MGANTELCATVTLPSFWLLAGWLLHASATEGKHLQRASRGGKNTSTAILLLEASLCFWKSISPSTTRHFFLQISAVCAFEVKGKEPSQKLKSFCIGRWKVKLVSSKMVCLLLSSLTGSFSKQQLPAVAVWTPTLQQQMLQKRCQYSNHFFWFARQLQDSAWVRRLYPLLPWAGPFCLELVIQDASPSWSVHNKSYWLFNVHAFMVKNSWARKDSEY